MKFEFAGEIWHWRGPAPYHFVTIPPEESAEIRAIATAVSYGWGMIPVNVQVGGSRWRTAMFAKDGGYVLPLRDSVRNRESLELGDVINVAIVVISGATER